MAVYYPPDGRAPQVELADRRRTVLARLRRAARQRRMKAPPNVQNETAEDTPEGADDGR